MISEQFMERYAVQELFNKLFICSYALYKPLYWLYKRIGERGKISQIRSLITPGMTVVDIGANIGYYTSIFSRLTGPSGKVVAFEPDALNFKRLSKTVRGARNVTTVHAASGAETKTISLYRSDKLNVDHQTYDSGEGRTATSVGCIALDDYFRNGETVDFVKIDTQGYDFFVLKGMRKTLARSPKVAILGELWPYGLARASADADAYLSLLRDYGFVVEIEDASLSSYGARKHDKFYYTDFFARKGY